MSRDRHKDKMLTDCAKQYGKSSSKRGAHCRIWGPPQSGETSQKQPSQAQGNSMPSRGDRKCRGPLGATVGRGQGWMAPPEHSQGPGVPTETSRQEGLETREVGK